MRGDRALDLSISRDPVIASRWRVEWLDNEGAVYITIFAGPSAEERARDFREAVADGRLSARIAEKHRGSRGRILKFKQNGAE
jgi:hypothetical protein